jgi:hypothetical protein
MVDLAFGTMAGPLDLLPFVPGICALVEPLGSWNEFPGSIAPIVYHGAHVPCLLLI